VIRRLLALALLLPSLAWAVCGTDNYSNTVCADTPTFYWRMDATSGTSETDKADSSNGTYASGFTLQATGIPANTDKAVTFDGTSGTKMVAIATGGGTSKGPSIGNGVGWTAEIWVKFTNFTDPGGGVIGVFTRYGHALQYQWDMALFTGTSKIRMQFWNDCNGSTATSIIAGAAASTGTWYHLVATTVGTGTQIGTGEFFINGVSQGTASNFNICANADASGDVEVANTEDNSLPFTGVADEPAIYTSVLSGTRITAHYNCGNAGTSCTGSAVTAGLPLSVKRDPLPKLRPWSPKEWFVAMRSR
jgi:hypothetical protein